MLPAQAKAYKQMVKDTLAEIEGGTLVGTNPLSRATRLLQFSSAYAELLTKELPDGRIETQVRLTNPSNKIKALIEDIDSGDYGEESLVIFAQSRQLIELLSAEMTAKKWDHGLITGAISMDDRQKHIDDFQARKVRFILVTIDAGGVGLTLTAGSTMIFMQRAWSSTAMKQAESRAHRIGSEIHDQVRIVDYVSQDTLEEAQVVRLDSKFARIESIVRDADLLKKLLTGEPISDGEVAPLGDSDASDDTSEDI
jgi:SNF2 family DNA or RNA helicase